MLSETQPYEGATEVVLTRKQRKALAKEQRKLNKKQKKNNKKKIGDEVCNCSCEAYTLLPSWHDSNCLINKGEKDAV